jgi:hypothetical protein
MQMRKNHCVQRLSGNAGLLQAQKSTGPAVEEQGLTVLQQNRRLGTARLRDTDTGAEQRDL